MSDYAKLKAGDRVRHKRYGAGTVTDVLPIYGDVILTVRFDSGSEKKLCASISKLEEEPPSEGNENEQ